MLDTTSMPGLGRTGAALVACAVAVAMTACVSLADTGPGRPDDLAALREQALRLVNEDRQAHGKAPLAADDLLGEIAQNHAADQLARGYYGHVTPGGKDVQDRYIAAGGEKWRLVAENIATCTGCAATAEEVARLQRGWMNSPEHRENILNGGLAKFGFGIAAQDGRLYAVQDFSGPGSSSGPAGGEAASPAALQAAALTAINEARRKAGVAPLEASDALAAGARAMLPSANAGSFEPGSMSDFTAGLPAAAKGDYRAYTTAIGICGGCGTTAAVGDARDFVEQWLGNTRQTKTLLDPDFTRMGFAVGANGEGKKIGIAALGQTR